MVSLVEITENNYLTVCRLEVAREQAGFVAAPLRFCLFQGKVNGYIITVSRYNNRQNISHLKSVN